MVNSHTAVLQSSHQHHQEQDEESEQHRHRQGHHLYQLEFEVFSVQVLCFIGEGGKTQNEAMVRVQRLRGSEDAQPFPRTGWMEDRGFEQDEGAERGATRRVDVVSISMNVESKREKMRSDRREGREEKRPGNAAPGTTVGFRSAGIVRARATEAGSSVS
jgi:hypothetical protein